MKFLALFALAGLALAAPAPQRPGAALPPASSSSSAATSDPSQACYNRSCGGGYPWKKDTIVEVAERAPEPIAEVIVERAPEPVVEVLEARQRPGAALPPASSSSASASAEPSQGCYNRSCGGGYPWKA